MSHSQEDEKSDSETAARPKMKIVQSISTETFLETLEHSISSTTSENSNETSDDNSSEKENDNETEEDKDMVIKLLRFEV
jgi:hypothetical protein